EARFGSGLIAFVPWTGRVEHTAADEEFYAAEFNSGEGWLDDAAADQMAFERELEDRYLRSCELFERCAACGATLDGRPTNALCSRCAEILESADAAGRGHCVIC